VVQIDTNPDPQMESTLGPNFRHHFEPGELLYVVLVTVSELGIPGHRLKGTILITFDEKHPYWSEDKYKAFCDCLKSHTNYSETFNAYVLQSKTLTSHFYIHPIGTVLGTHTSLAVRHPCDRGPLALWSTRKLKKQDKTRSMTLVKSQKRQSFMDQVQNGSLKGERIFMLTFSSMLTEISGALPKPDDLLVRRRRVPGRPRKLTLMKCECLKYSKQRLLT